MKAIALLRNAFVLLVSSREGMFIASHYKIILFSLLLRVGRKSNKELSVPSKQKNVARGRMDLSGTSGKIYRLLPSLCFLVSSWFQGYYEKSFLHSISRVLCVSSFSLRLKRSQGKLNLFFSFSLFCALLRKTIFYSSPRM